MVQNVLTEITYIPHFRQPQRRQGATVRCAFAFFLALMLSPLDVRAQMQIQDAPMAGTPPEA